MALKKPSFLSFSKSKNLKSQKFIYFYFYVQFYTDRV